MSDLTPPLEIHDLTVSYQKKPVLWGVDLIVPPGKLVGIVGPNGAGRRLAMIPSYRCEHRLETHPFFRPATRGGAPHRLFEYQTGLGGRSERKPDPGWWPKRSRNDDRYRASRQGVPTHASGNGPNRRARLAFVAKRMQQSARATNAPCGARRNW